MFKRNSNIIKLAQFWEYWQLRKYNINPKFQRKSSVWSDEKKAYLIDTLFRNYPIPPIFLREHIDSTTGETKYDVIDGKQRIESIVAFLDGRLALPDDIYDETYTSLKSLRITDIRREPDLGAFLVNFWRYEIPIEYIATDDVLVINEIFDRLNRNGEPLTNQELRHSKYIDTDLYRTIEKLKSIDFWQANLTKLKDNRMEDDEFISELLFFIISGKIEDSNPLKLDNHYRKYSKYNGEKLYEYEDRFISLTNQMMEFIPNLSDYKIASTSHLYGLWCFTYKAISQEARNNTRHCLLDFFNRLRSKDYNNDVIRKYKNSMSAGTKSRIQRIRRANALLEFCGYSDLYQEPRNRQA